MPSSIHDRTVRFESTEQLNPHTVVVVVVLPVPRQRPNSPHTVAFNDER